MKEEELDDFDEEEFELLINGLIHPGDMFTPPDFMPGAFPPPFGGMPGSTPAPGLGNLDGMLAAAYVDLDEEDDLF